MYLIVEWLIVTNWIICYRTTPGIHVTSYFTLKYCPNEIPPSSAIATHGYKLSLSGRLLCTFRTLKNLERDEGRGV